VLAVTYSIDPVWQKLEGLTRIYFCLFVRARHAAMGKQVLRLAYA
jgi:hypothetical protein